MRRSSERLSNGEGEMLALPSYNGKQETYSRIKMVGIIDMRDSPHGRIVLVIDNDLQD